MSLRRNGEAEVLQALEPLDHSLHHRAVVSEPDRPRKDQDASGQHPVEKWRPVDVRALLGPSNRGGTTAASTAIPPRRVCFP
jgi:hypothetical protein